MNTLHYAMPMEENTLQNQFRFIRKDGKIIWMEMSNRITLDKKGIVIGVSGTLMDITKAKSYQTALSVTNQRFKALIDNMQAGILLEDENHKIIILNDMFCKY